MGTLQFEAFTGTVDRSALIAGHVALEGTDEFRFPTFEPVVDVDNAPMKAFRHNFLLIYRRLRAGIDQNDLSFGLFQEMIIYQFLTAWPRSSGLNSNGVVLRPSWQVRKALDYIEANLRTKLTIAEVAAAANFSVRSMQASFRRELGKTPITWIMERRLAGVHDELTSSAEMYGGVADIARRWGFTHMGDFSKRYRERYGETPLKSRRQHV